MGLACLLFGYHTETCPQETPHTLPVGIIGDAGTAVGARLKGHFKMGGRSLCWLHCRYGPTLILDENKSSCLCIFCFEVVKLAQGMRPSWSDGKMRMNSLQGATVCVNRSFISHVAGYTVRGRDTQASAAIGLAATAILLDSDRAPLPLFQRSTLPSSVQQALSEP
ncbi:hypothetical protein KI688_007485 [Linnemannia hyalina]|uniref:Uncharacterized protein n=1 Tax=Linnemannia hyalina TaxID=64524 RepID=A0A9P7XIC5_9FUNG|nr:hypothetical protein KI688_007485 [Linnemannia hyalina]